MRKLDPYLFLNPFTVHDAHLFFGREKEIKHLATLLNQQQHVVLFGPIGAGKTSLIQAGLTSHLTQQGIQVYTLRMTPSQVYHVHSLEGAVQPASMPWSEWVKQYLKPEQPTVVAFDQLDVFFDRTARTEIARFAIELAQTMNDYPLLHLIWVVREMDLFYLDLFSDAFPHVLNTRYHINHLTPGQAKQAVVGLAEQAGIHYSDDLLTTLLIDLGPNEIAATRLQVVCWALYKHLNHDETCVGLPTYHKLGGVRALLTSYLDDLLNDLSDEEEQEMARALLKEMVELVNPSAAWDIRIPTSNELSRLTGNAPQRLKHLFGFWQARRVIREVPEGYTLAHAFLIDRVSEWAQEDKWATKDVRDLLQRALLAYWRTGKLIDKQGLGRLRQSCTRMRFSDQGLELILRSALARGYQWRHWVDYAAGAGISVWQLVRETLESQDAHSRSSAVTALSALSGPEIVELLSTALADPFPNVRGLARNALARLGTQEAVQVLRNTPPLNMVLIPAGTFLMGSDENADEQPPRQVYLDAFYIDLTSVTNAEYAKFIQDTGYPPPAHWERSGGTFAPGRGNHPVAYVCWFDARDYAAWAGKRLPTEAEWEKAARGVDGRRYPWGDQFNSLCCNTDESAYWGTTPVDAFSHQGDSPYGVADMSGNVWEWVADWYDRDYYRTAPDRNPPGPEKGKTKVVRGGAWEFSAHESRCAMRNYEYPGPRHGLIGFRCAAAPRTRQV